MAPPAPDEQACWRRHEDLAEVVSDGRVAILRLARLSEPPVILEGSGAAIWQLIDGPTAFADLTKAVASVYDVDPGEVAPAVGDFLDRLTEEGLLVRTPRRP